MLLLRRLLVGRPIRPWNLHPLNGSPIHDPSQSAHRAQNPRINDISLLVYRILSHPKPNTLYDCQHPGLLSLRHLALKFLCTQELPLN